MRLTSRAIRLMAACASIAELHEQGIACSEKRIARLMRLSEIAVVSPNQCMMTIDSAHALPIATACLPVSLPPQRPTRAVRRTLPLSGHAKDGSTWRSFSPHCRVCIGNDLIAFSASIGSLDSSCFSAARLGSLCLSERGSQYTKTPQKRGRIRKTL